MIQSVVLDKSKFSRSEAIAWVKDHGFEPNTTAPNFATTNYWRFRQATPKRGLRYRTKVIRPGIELILAYGNTASRTKKRTKRGTRKRS